MLGKDGPRRYQVHQAYLTSTRQMQEVRPTETVAFFRSLTETAGDCSRSVRAREILESCYYPHITKEVRRPLDLSRTDIQARNIEPSTEV